MKAREMIEMLQKVDPETEVYVTRPTHNHWRQTAVDPIAFGEFSEVIWDDYVNGLRIAIREDDGADNEVQRHFVLR